MERLLLPRKKQRALEQMAAVLSGWVKQPDWIQSSEQADQIKMLMDILSPNGRSDCPDGGSWLMHGSTWLDLHGHAIWIEVLVRQLSPGCGISRKAC